MWTIRNIFVHVSVNRHIHVVLVSVNVKHSYLDGATHLHLPTMFLF
jgi:hypothetical protein